MGSCCSGNCSGNSIPGNQVVGRLKSMDKSAGVKRSTDRSAEVR
jgi:hypothetical protein